MLMTQSEKIALPPVQAYMQKPHVKVDKVYFSTMDLDLVEVANYRDIVIQYSLIAGI